jgi:rhodanese-related sulfurtransferase
VDGVGSVLYGAGLLGFGYFFSRQIDQIGAAFTRVGGSALTFIIGLAALYVAYKYWQRQRLLHELRMARITVSELRQKLEAGEAPLIFDLRSKAAVEQDPALIQGAIHLGMEEIEQRLDKLPRDRDVIVYCSCPNEVSSARLALRLQRKGFTRVRPLLGGLDAWREQNYPMQPGTAVVAGAVGITSTNREPAPLNVAGGASLKTAEIRPATPSEGERT